MAEVVIPILDKQADSGSGLILRAWTSCLLHLQASRRTVMPLAELQMPRQQRRPPLRLMRLPVHRMPP